MKRQINTLPVPTFRWLKMNGTLLEESVLPQEVRTVTAAAGTTETVFLTASGESQTAAALSADAASAGYHLILEKDARLNLIQIITGAGDAPLVQEITADCGENAQLHVYWIFTGGAAVYPSVTAELTGAGSSFVLDGAYIVRPSETLDMNIVVNHSGRDTESRIQVRGVLYDRAKKIFRGTIDFKRGCKGAVGDEREEVLLMDDEAVNQTVPLILCAEEDVAGNHGASIGRIDEEEQFYLASRGLSPEEIEEILLAARIRAVVGKMPQEVRGKAEAAAGLSRFGALSEDAEAVGVFRGDRA